MIAAERLLEARRRRDARAGELAAGRLPSNARRSGASRKTAVRVAEGVEESSARRSGRRPRRRQDWSWAGREGRARAPAELRRLDVPEGQVRRGRVFDEACACAKSKRRLASAASFSKRSARTNYIDSARSRPKTVRYWRMRPLAGEFEPQPEVDEIRWETPEDDCRPAPPGRATCRCWRACRRACSSVTTLGRRQAPLERRRPASPARPSRSGTRRNGARRGCCDPLGDSAASSRAPTLAASRRSSRSLRRLACRSSTTIASAREWSAGRSRAAVTRTVSWPARTETSSAELAVAEEA